MTHHFTSGFVTRTPSWHGLATVVNEEIYSSQEAIKMAECDWEVVKLQHEIRDPLDGELNLVPDCFGMYRKDTMTYLGKVGSGYTPLQNSSAFTFFDPFLADRDIFLSTAGSLKGGRVIWIQAELKQGNTAEIVEGDIIQQRLLLANSHDMSIPLEISWPTERVVCANTLGYARNQVKRSGNYRRIKHTKNINVKLHDVQSALNLAKQDFSNTVKDYKFLASKDMTVKQMEVYLEDIFADQLAKENKKGVRDVTTYPITRRILDLYDSSPDLQTDNVRGTAYAAYNAVSEYITHESGRNLDNRVYSNWFDTGRKFLNESLEKLLVLA